MTGVRLAPPFALEDDDGVVDHSRVVKRRAIRCALSRICGVCAEPLTRPIAYLGSEHEARDGLFTFPPSHHGCAVEAVENFSPMGDGHLGQVLAPGHWAVVTTGGFELIRPTRRGDPVRFRPNSVIGTTVS